MTSIFPRASANPLLAGLLAAPLLLGATLAGAQVLPPPGEGPGVEAPARGPAAERGPDGASERAERRADRRERDEGPRGPRGEREGRRGVEIDAAAVEASLREAGYRDVALVDTGRRHAEFVGVGEDGRRWLVKVDEDGRVREREPFLAPLGAEEARAAVEALGYTEVGPASTHRRHVEVQARAADGRVVTVELNADGSLRKEKFED